MIICPDCGSPNDDNSLECSNCGKVLSHSTGEQRSFMKSQLKGSLISSKKASTSKTQAIIESESLEPQVETGRLKGKLVGNNTATKPTNKSSLELFKRSTRIQERLPNGKIEIPAPPAVVSKPEINWLSTLLPAGVTVALAVTMALAFQNTMMMLYTLPMTLAGLVVSIVNYFRGNKSFEKSSEKRKTAYMEKLDEVEATIKDKREAQKRAMLLADPNPEDCFDAVKTRSTKLWCREPDDTDFVSVRIGTGTVPFSMKLSWSQEQLMETDELKKKPGELYHSYNTVKNMPVLCNIRSSEVVGLIGTPKQTKSQLQNMVFHLTTHHCYSDLKIVCFYNEEDKEELGWLSNLPHTHAAPQGDSYIASDQEAADKLFHDFTELFKQRKQELQENNSYGNDPQFTPYVLFVFFEPKLLKKSNPINQFLFLEHGLGIGCLMAAQKIAQLPKQCTDIISLSDGEGEIYNTTHASERQSFRPDMISSELKQMFGQSMSPLYCDEGIEISSLPKQYSFYQMLGVDSISEVDIGKRWKHSDILTSTVAPSAPFGIKENGELVIFNSPPTGENGGAHALFAGTNGSGKSEVLLSIVLSLSLCYPPDEVSFLIIDFKGDSIAGSLKGLPHVRGVITNLDGDELRRSLASISAENLKREKLFKEYNDSHPEEKKEIKGIRYYTELYKKGKVNEPLPHLFIVVDEFAELKKQLPDIMDKFLSVAQKGRSLGVHLVLATQSPSGVVDGKIRANVLKQICLKVANSGESRDMINSDLAAKIKNPGRGYLKIDDSLTLFQSAYSGGKVLLSDGNESTQFREAADAIANYCRTHEIQKLPDIFCQPLLDKVTFPQTPSRDNTTLPFGSIPIGIRDDPSRQFQGEYCIDIFSRNTLIVGSQMMGKTNLLQTIIYGVSQRYSPEEVNIYILDFASLFLKNYETLPHVGGVVTITESEKITNLFRLLNEEMEQRRKRFMFAGVSNYGAYMESGAQDLPQILVMVDDLAAAKAYFPVDNDPLLSLCKEGLALGISVIATTTQPVGSTSYLPTFAIANRIAFYNNDVTVYSALLGHNTFKLKEKPGRCLVSIENTVYECQTYLAFATADMEKEIERAQTIREYCRNQVDKAGRIKAKPIPFIPKDLTAIEAISTYADAYCNGKLMMGLDYATVKPLSIKLASVGMLAISGRADEVNNYQRYILTAAENAKGLKTEFYIVDGIDRTLQSFSNYSCVAEYSFLPDQAKQMILQVQMKAEERYAIVTSGDASVLDTSPTLVLLLNTAEAINVIQTDKAALQAWSALMNKLKAMNVCIIFGALDNVSIPYSSEILRKFRDDRKLVFFDDLSNLRIGELPYSIIRTFNEPLQKYDGYCIIGNETARIRVPHCPLSEESI